MRDKKISPKLDFNSRIARILTFSFFLVAINLKFQLYFVPKFNPPVTEDNFSLLLHKQNHADFHVTIPRRK